jgi:hypothetical protein
MANFALIVLTEPKAGREDIDKPQRVPAQMLRRVAAR